MSTRPPRGWFSPVFVIGLALTCVVEGAIVMVAQNRRDISVSARKYSYQSGSGGDIRVQKDDLVRITFSAEDIPHSFTIDRYRISKRAEPGKPVTFEFRADQAGEFEIYCNLTIDEQCAQKMKGRLVVEGK
ncbi:MAG TPA: cupredoxin domain-containing protein [Vicinamibacterales bacterium]|nr:cupredoxin domain-containing protein [Vicinamibacterales bacterium]